MTAQFKAAEFAVADHSAYPLRRDNFIDCLRALAVVMVLFTHYHGWLPGGSVGVSIFFCLSGFLITRILLRFPELSPSNVAQFIFRRFMRVWPMMAVQILLVLLCMKIMAPQNLEKYLPFVPGLLTFTGGYGEWVGFSPAVLWTLRAEFWFYVLFPLVLCAAGREKIVSVVVIGIAVGWLSKLMFGHYFGGWLAHFSVLMPVLKTIQPYIFTFDYLDQLMYGAAASVMIDRHSALLRHFEDRRILWLCIIALGALATIPFKAFDLVWYLQTSASALVTAVILMHQEKSPITGDFEPLATLGRISFSIYLLHGVAVDYLPFQMVNEQFGALVVMFTILIASIASYRWIELPFIRMSKRLAPL